MTTPDRLSGVLCPVLTPFDSELGPDLQRLFEHCRWLLSQRVGLVLFGTTSEANSLSMDERIALLDGLVDAGLDPRHIVAGTGCCALPDTVRLTRHATALGCAGTLMLPPFYYKGVSDDGLYASYAEVIERTGNDALRIYLYHIPPVSQVGLSIELVERLLASYPDTVAGIKDSSGDWRNTQAMLSRAWPDFRVLVGTESLLLENMRAGGAGCISATANVNPAAIQRLFASWQHADAERMQRELDALRAVVQRYPVIPALKAIIAAQREDPGWESLRPPLLALDAPRKRELESALESIGFEMAV